MMKQRICNILYESMSFKDRPNINDAFWKWFGNSKVVDSNGDPLVVYHGTYNDILDFLSFNTRRSHRDKMGSYFTHDPDLASKMHGGLKRIIPVYLSIQNPFDVKDVERENIAQVAGYDQTVQSVMRAQGRAGQYSTLEFLDNRYDLVPRLKKKGYDGVIFDGEQEGITYVVFKPTQVKSVFNRGTWELNNPEMSK